MAVQTIQTRSKTQIQKHQMTHVEVTLTPIMIGEVENRRQLLWIGTGFTVPSPRNAYIALEDVIKSPILNAHSSKTRQQAKLLLRMKLDAIISLEALHPTQPHTNVRVGATTRTHRLCCQQCTTCKSLSKALLFAEHGENMLCTKIVLNVRNNFCTQHILPPVLYTVGQ